MATIRDLKNLIRCEDTIHIGGATAEFLTEYKERGQKLAAAMVEEFGVPLETIDKLPPETPLGIRAERCFSELDQWLATQLPSVK